MSTPKHTPGPWVLSEGNECIYVRSNVHPNAIAAVEYDFNSDIDDTTEEAQANAHLIAAAPVMYAVLKEAFYALSYHMPDRFDDEEQECAWHQRMLKIEQVFAQVESKS